MSRALFTIGACFSAAFFVANWLGFFGPAYGYEVIHWWFDWSVTVFLTALFYSGYWAISFFTRTRG
jgi:hypothetical protein